MAVPRVSLILPVRDDAAQTMRCLVRLAELPDEPTFEVVLVDDASTDRTADLLAGLEGDVTVLTHDAPVGFGRACDRAVEAARGEIVVLVTQSAIPCAGWLGELVGVLDADPEIAAALPRSVDQRGVFLSDAHWQALAVRRERYRELGGFELTAQHGRAEKASLVGALRAGGELTLAPCALLLAA